MNNIIMKKVIICKKHTNYWVVTIAKKFEMVYGMIPSLKRM